MRKFSSFIIVVNKYWDYDATLPNLESVQIHCIDVNQGVGVITLKKKISLEEAYKLFNNKNILIFPILNLSQYWEYNEQVSNIDDVKERMKFNKSWFSVKKTENPEKI